MYLAMWSFQRLTVPKTNVAVKNRPSEKESCLPTSHFDRTTTASSDQMAAFACLEALTYL